MVILMCSYMHLLPLCSDSPASHLTCSTSSMQSRINAKYYGDRIVNLGAGDSSDELEHSCVTSMSGAGEKVNKNDAGATFHVTILRTKSTGQMIYLEAEKNLVDVLLSFLVLPVGTIIGMLNAEGLVNSTTSNLCRLGLVVIP